MVFNGETYSNLIEYFELLGVDMNIYDMSFSVSLDQGRGCEWGTRNGFSSLFAQKKNVLNPYFWQMIREIIRFKQDVISHLEELDNNPDIDRNETLGQFIKVTWLFGAISEDLSGSNMCFNMVLLIGRSNGLFCLLHSFILPRPTSSAESW
ncbi:hypothetical protein RDI58_023261 [Solanum bulbocastanum]|uniref:Uncharacterized protein n=1 Tax=Solanum bulbocastanum TaxID=147425 RepID=A0AAN8Y6J3_SOLBU